MRKILLAAAALASLSSAAWAQGDATRAPAPLGQGPGTYRYQDEAPPAADARDPNDRTEDRPADDQAARDARREERLDQNQAALRRDVFCRSDAAERTGYAAGASARAEAAYGDAYRACMDTAQDDDDRDFGRDRGRTAYDYPPPPVYGRAWPGPYYYPYPRLYGPSFGLSFGFGSGYRGSYGPPPRAYGPPRGTGPRGNGPRANGPQGRR